MLKNPAGENSYGIILAYVSWKCNYYITPLLATKVRKVALSVRM